MRWRRALVWTGGGLIALVALLFAGLQTEPGQRTLAAFVSSAASSADSKLEISGLSGFFPTDLRVEKVELSDREGAWLKAVGARLRWSFASLFSGRLKVEQVAAEQIEVLRAPQPGEQSSDGGGGLPMGIDLATLSIDDLHVGALLGGVDSHWKLSGSALLAAHTQSHLKLEMNRSDGPTAHLHADIGFGLDRFNVDGEVLAEESTKGGVIATLIGRPDLDKVSLRLVARGDRGDGTANLAAEAGDAVTANGAARWHRDGGTTAISLDVSLVGPGLPDNPIGRLLRSPAKLAGEATLDDAGLLIVQRASLDVGPAKLNVTARYDTAADKLAATADLQAGEAGPLADLAGGVTWRDLHLNAKAELAGVAKKPQGTAALTASADDVVVASLVGGAPPPGHVDVNAKLGLQPDGRLIVDMFDARTDVLAAKLTGGYMPSSRDGEGKLTLDVPDLARFSTIAGIVLAGRSHLELSARARNDDLRADWQGTLDDLSLPGMPPGLARQAVRLSGGAGLQRDQSWRLDAVRMASDGFTFEASGRGRQRAGEIDLSLALPRLGVLQDDVGGSATAKGEVMLKSTGGDLHFTADLAGLSRGGIASRKLALTLDTSLEGEAVSGSIKANGDLANQPVTLDGRFARKADGGIVVPSVNGSWASAAIDVKDLAVTPTGATGSGHIRMAHLEDLAPLLGTDLSGGIDLQIDTEPEAAGKVKLALRGDGLHSGGTGVGDLQVDATVSDPLGAAAADATIKARRLSGVADIGQVTATVKGDRSAFDFSLRAIGARTSASLVAKVEPTADETRVALQRFEGRYQGVPLALAAPAHVKVAGARVAIEPASFRLGGGQLSVSGTVDPAASDLTLAIAALPLTLLEAFAPGSGVEGTGQAKLHVTGPLAAPHIEATYAANGLRIKRPETALLPALALQGTASVVGQQATFDAKVTAGGATNLGVKGKATIPQGKAPLAATIALTGSVDIAPFSPAIGNDVRSVAGTLRTDLTLNVKNTAVSGSGTMSLSGAAFSLPDSGLRLSGGQASLALQGDTLQLQKLSFQTARNGEVSATGTVRLEPAQGFPVDLAVTTRKALLANRPDLLASVSSEIKVTGSSSTGFDVSGTATIDRAEIAIGVGQAANYPTLPVREINGTATPNPAAPPPAKAAPRPAGATPIRLALKVEAPQAVFVRGRGLDAEVGGQFTVTGDPSKPAVLGSLSLRRGTFNLAGHRLDFTRGNVSLVTATTIDPLLDFVATTTVNSTVIEVDITGTSRAPKIELTSTPQLPQDEAMALLLFGKPSSGLSPFELLSAAQALSELTGRTPVGGSVIGKVRGGLGLDQLSINSSSSNPRNPTSGTTTSVEGGRYVSPGVYVGARQGASSDSSRGVVEVEVLKHTKLTGDIGADSTGKVGAKMEWDY
jgi:translocation and assembly module TamB